MTIEPQEMTTLISLCHHTGQQTVPMPFTENYCDIKGSSHINPFQVSLSPSWGEIIGTTLTLMNVSVFQWLSCCRGELRNLSDWINYEVNHPGITLNSLKRKNPLHFLSGGCNILHQRHVNFVIPNHMHLSSGLSEASWLPSVWREKDFRMGPDLSVRLSITWGVCSYSSWSLSSFLYPQQVTFTALLLFYKDREDF